MLEEIIAGTTVRWKNPRIVCTDGFSISVQASEFHYCSPQDNMGPYTKLELGFPTAPLPTVFDEFHVAYAVWGYVPVDLVRELIAGHGGEL